MTDQTTPKPKPPRKRSQFGLRRTPKHRPADPKKVAAWLRFIGVPVK